MISAIDPAILKERFTTTPSQMSPQIMALAHDLSPDHSPQFLPLVTEPGCQTGECFFNVQTKVERDGGEIIYGWAIWEWPRVFIEAEHHAVWSDGQRWTDITPNDAGMDRILFLADPTRLFDYEGYRRLPNFKRPLNSVSVVRDWIDATDNIQNYLESTSQGQTMRPDRRMLSALYSGARTAQARLLVWLAENTSRNDKCICTSGKKFKKCCSKYFR